ncbi:MAG: ribbon-helix-helix protein, CopG family [Deltaproteobacteria bacterium]|nr:ribbon-helix-helix protein, CopG family [Deltaproteobacteria bacterium]MBW1908021.1 ribbon-helix-helix protein, CopG family [Deltaproteobacteria bacterium]MBW2033542.1 ribbon-helix-helix protein, CopG family [Deltaproteobacteria bacterium]MBW2113965.1 ribbon-helix-helix protein, CopG family [Deltaproteobacteria bacterium]MBW2169209.1 ribbon-helix-helix protein, CopG family [Deltaproteobacteria bacterium]
MIRTQIQMEEDQIDWLRVEARSRGVSVSQLIREGVALFRAREERFPEEKKKRALAAVGRFSSNLSEVSERHDDYLAEAFRKEARHGK